MGDLMFIGFILELILVLAFVFGVGYVLSGAVSFCPIFFGIVAFLAYINILND